ncbi:MAG: hypothetical protein K1X36_00365 [Pyrinomonadaceae bacterium]|nr:hypothetical protein [Pyrinomonadaceae bacterium]
MPKDTLGFTPGDDRKLASWASIVDYFKRLDVASDRVKFEEIGKTTMGAPFVYATISSPENLKRIKKYEEINAKLADPRTIKSSDAAAKALIKEGKTIVLITCGVHSTEVGSTLSSMLIAYRLASSTEPEIKKILDNTIILMVPSLNPDGVDIVKNWYDKTLGTPYEGTEPPELYHKYVGHDNNRDWYAFTQVETQLTVDKIHNVWHPQIVHDIHQQGAFGSRLFLPPYMPPVEPNVPKQIVEGYTELGNAMAADLRKQGFQGITTNSTYDAWTPARAYSHYHGGVRILSETASARLATPINVSFDQLRGSEGYDAKKESANFGPIWKGGEWKLRNITDYMTGAAFSLLNHAANNREKWLSRFYEIGKEAVRPRKDGELFGLALVPSWNGQEIVKILERGGIEIEAAKGSSIGETTIKEGTRVIRAAQPYFALAKGLLESQKYPNLLDENGHPIAPYDVTGHTLSLLMDVKVIPIFQEFETYKGGWGFGSGGGSSRCYGTLDYRIYKSHVPSMDEGWSRWAVEKYEHMLPNRARYCSVRHDSIRNDQLNQNYLSNSVNVIIFPDQSPLQILNGYAKGTMPDEYTGGVGKEGVENLKKFVEAGGTLVFMNRSSNFAIREFNLPIKDVTAGLARKDFYIPGSILRTELDLTSPIAKGMPQQSIAWFENGPAFEVDPSAWSTGFSRPSADKKPPEGGTPSVTVIAKYPADPKQILLSGWALGSDKIAGKAALVEVKIGKGKIILFGFRPQYRGQSLATFPLLFNAISQ